MSQDCHNFVKTLCRSMLSLPTVGYGAVVSPLTDNGGARLTLIFDATLYMENIVSIFLFGGFNPFVTDT
jgi:hypothetical protein